MGAPMFQDTRIKTVIFPDVAVGDRVYLHRRKIRTTPLYPGQFEDWTFSSYYKVLSQTLRYSLPASMPLYSDARGYAATPPRVHADRTVYEWVLAAGDNPRIENNGVAFIDHGRRLLVSTFADKASIRRNSCCDSRLLRETSRTSRCRIS